MRCHLASAMVQLPSLVLSEHCGKPIAVGRCQRDNLPGFTESEVRCRELNRHTLLITIRPILDTLDLFSRIPGRAVFAKMPPNDRDRQFRRVSSSIPITIPMPTVPPRVPQTTAHGRHTAATGASLAPNGHIHPPGGNIRPVGRTRPHNGS